MCRALHLQAHHGDWFGGKAVGLAVLNIGSLTANVYVTHVGILPTSAMRGGPFDERRVVIVALFSTAPRRVLQG